MELFPVEINRADYGMLLRVPGIGVKSAKRIAAARKGAELDFFDLKKLGVVLKRAVYFITCRGKMMYPLKVDQQFITSQLVGEERKKVWDIRSTDSYRQISMFDDGWLAPEPTGEDVYTAVLGQI